MSKTPFSLAGIRAQIINPELPVETRCLIAEGLYAHLRSDRTLDEFREQSKPIFGSDTTQQADSIIGMIADLLEMRLVDEEDVEIALVFAVTGRVHRDKPYRSPAVIKLAMVMLRASPMLAEHGEELLMNLAIGTANTTRTFQKEVTAELIAEIRHLRRTEKVVKNEGD